MISKADIEQRRSPQVLYDYVESVKDAVNADPVEIKKGFLKKDYYKEFLDEILPLSRFARLHYPSGYSIEPVLGNQGYDALVFDEHGQEVDRVEITSPQDGHDEAESNRLVVERGFGKTKTAPFNNVFEGLLPHVIETCNAKAQKDYSDCSLVIAVAPLFSFAGYESLMDLQVKHLAAEIRRIKFKAKRAFLLVLPDLLLQI